MVNVERLARVIDGLQLVFIELPKFKVEGKLAPLKEAWLRFLRETGDADTPEEGATLRSEVGSRAPEIDEAIDLSGEAAFSRAELEAYDRYWDIIRTERTLFSGKYAEGKAAGIEEGREAGREEDREEGREEMRAALLARLIAGGMSEAQARTMLDL